MFDSSGKDQTPQKITQVVGQNKQSQPHLIRDKMLAGQSRPVQRILAFLDPLLGRATTVVKVNHALGSCAHIGHGETDPRKKFVSMPLAQWRSMFDFNLMKITAEQIQSVRTLSEALDVAEARRIYLSEEWTHPFYPP